MKLSITILASTILMTSCYKQKNQTPPRYTCSCKVEMGGAYKTNSYLLENMTYQQAEKNCSDRSGIKSYQFGENSSYDETWTCQLK